MAALLPAPVDYTDIDFDSLFARLKVLLASVFPDLHVDDTAELANILLSGKAHVGDVLMYYLRRQGREARITTATQRGNLVALCKLIGYKPPGATAATLDERFTLAAPTAGDVPLPAGTIVKTADVTDPIEFQLLADLVIEAGETEATASAENSAQATDAFSSSRAPTQRFVLSSAPYLDESATITAGNGTYTRVENFLASTPTDRHFTEVVDQRDRCTITFGDGVNGAIPTGTISVTYKTGGGAAGKVDANTVTVLPGNFTDSLGNPVRISVTNPERSSGGTDRQSSALIRILAPESLRVLERCVAREDYEIAAKRVPGVARALHLSRDQDEAVQENEGYTWVVPEDGGTASAALLAQVAAQYAEDGPLPGTTTYRVHTVAAPYKTVDVLAVVWIRKGYAAAVVRQSILDALESFFAITVSARSIGQNVDGDVPNPLIDFGYYLQDADGEPTGFLAFSDIQNAVRDAAGVLRVGAGAGEFLLNGERADVELVPREFPQLGTVSIINGATQLPL